MRRAPFAIEYRTRSRRTASGWTKWQHWAVAPSRESAEEQIAKPWLQDWMKRDDGEMRIVDRADSQPGASGEAGTVTRPAGSEESTT